MGKIIKVAKEMNNELGLGGKKEKAFDFFFTHSPRRDNSNRETYRALHLLFACYTVH